MILEKTYLTGGTTARSGGVMWIPNNRFMRRDGVKDSPETATAYLDSVVGDHEDTPGAALQGRILQAAVKAGGELRTQSAVTELIVENTAIRGVVTVRHGKPHRIGARLGVLVNAGGFAHVQEMRYEYQPRTSGNWSRAIEGDTGEMILETMRHVRPSRRWKKW